MGVIDVNTRVREAHAASGDRSASRPCSLAETASAYALAMDCVGASFLLGSTPGLEPREVVDAENEALFGWVQTADRPVLFFAGIDLLERDAADRLSEWAERGAAGITIAPADQGVRPTDDRCCLVLEAAARHDVPVIVSNPGLEAGAGVLGFADAALFDEPMAQIRGLRLVLGEFGRYAIDSTMTMLARHAGVFAETSWLADRPTALWQVVSAAHERGVLDKVLFGSGYPRVTPQRAIAGLYSMQSWVSRSMDQALPREAVRAMVERDALAELRIAHDLVPARHGKRGHDASTDVVVPRRARRALPVRGWE